MIYRTSNNSKVWEVGNILYAGEHDYVLFNKKGLNIKYYDLSSYKAVNYNDEKTIFFIAKHLVLNKKLLKLL